ncbi:MAG TPA: alpha/beta hydrolase [Streptomyces sp.]|nr:alpha/beta hydrolase [Streptomyces sp.]
MTTSTPHSGGPDPVPPEAIGPPPAFDPEQAVALENLLARTPSAVPFDMLPARRASLAATEAASYDELCADGAFAVSERVVPGPVGAPDVKLLICLPAGAAAPVAALFFIHGGGMILGNRYVGLADCLAIGRELGTAVVSVEYRLAPEHPHPAPVEDCHAALLWVADNAAELGIDPDKVIVAGGSAGGGLAAATALLVRDRGGPRLLGQLLTCPMLDDRNNTRSARQMAGVGLCDQQANAHHWTALLGTHRGGADVSQYAAPARAKDLSALPPAFVHVGSAETFRDEAVDYARRIWQAGGNAELHVWPGGFHDFTVHAPDTALTRSATAAMVSWVRRLLAP